MTEPESASLKLAEGPSAINSKILIAARQDFAVDGIVSILESCEDSYLVSCVEPGKSCMRKLSAIAPDILLIHTSVAPDPVGEFIHGILGEFPALRIMLFGNGMYKIMPGIMLVMCALYLSGKLGWLDHFKTVS